MHSSEIITSRQNPSVRHARNVRDGRVKDQIFVEGLRLCEEAVSAGLEIETVFVTQRMKDDDRAARLLARLEGAGRRVLTVSESVFDSFSDTRTPQGVAALARRPPTGPEVVEAALPGDAPLLVVMHRVGNPSNAGAMLRVAEAAGATGAVTTEGSTDLFSPKALRGAMGSAFRLPLWTGARLEEVLAFCRARGVRTVSAAASAPSAHTDLDWTHARAVILGPEGEGLSADEAGAADEQVRIPMRAPVESLNVAVALGVILYEAARQRGGGAKG